MRLWLACLLHKTSSYRISRAGSVSHIPSSEASLKILLGPIHLDAGHPGGFSDFILCSFKAAIHVGPQPNRYGKLPVLLYRLGGCGILKSSGLTTRHQCGLKILVTRSHPAGGHQLTKLCLGMGICLPIEVNLAITHVLQLECVLGPECPSTPEWTPSAQKGSEQGQVVSG